MNAVACLIMCSCGGHVQVLPEDGVYYVLTKRQTIVFQGQCSQCFGAVRVEKPILELMLHCPVDEKRVH